MKIYHHNDFDGRCAAAIVRRSVSRIGGFFPEEFIEVDYKDKIKVEDIKTDETVLILDFSFKPEVMAEVLKRTTKVIWIDHHKTAFEYDYSYGVHLLGLLDAKFSGCELTWKYYFPDKPIPKGVQLIGDYDIWAFRHGELTEDYNLGLWLYDTVPHSFNSCWNKFVFTDDKKLIEEVANKGKLVKLFRDNFCNDYVKSFGFETEFDGHKAFAMGLTEFGSKAFGDKIKEYPICINFEFNGEVWTIGLYSETLDVGAIAKKYGGGGHTGAAGFTWANWELPFKKQRINAV